MVDSWGDDVVGGVESVGYGELGGVCHRCGHCR